jgi:hypothetical protein
MADESGGHPWAYAGARCPYPSAIEIRDLRTVFPNGVVALDGVDLDVARAERRRRALELLAL